MTGQHQDECPETAIKTRHVWLPVAVGALAGFAVTVVLPAALLAYVWRGGGAFVNEHPDLHWISYVWSGLTGLYEGVNGIGMDPESHFIWPSWVIIGALLGFLWHLRKARADSVEKPKARKRPFTFLRLAALFSYVLMLGMTSLTMPLSLIIPVRNPPDSTFSLYGAALSPCLALLLAMYVFLRQRVGNKYVTLVAMVLLGVQLAYLLWFGYTEILPIILELLFRT